MELLQRIFALLVGVAVIVQSLQGLIHLDKIGVVEAGGGAVFAQYAVELRVVAQQLRTGPAQVGHLAFETGGAGLVAHLADLVKGDIAVFNEAVEVILVKQVLVDVGDIGVNIQRHAVVLAFDVGTFPRAGDVVFLDDAVFKQGVQGPDHLLLYEHGDTLDVHDGDIRHALGGLHGQGQLLVQVVSGHGGVVDLHVTLRGVESIHHALHGRAVGAGKYGPVLDLDGGCHCGYGQSQYHHQAQNQRKGLFHGGSSFSNIFSRLGAIRTYVRYTCI